MRRSDAARHSKFLSSILKIKRKASLSIYSSFVLYPQLILVAKLTISIRAGCPANHTTFEMKILETQSQVSYPTILDNAKIGS